MNEPQTYQPPKPTPAVVAQSDVVRLPRVVLIGLCLAYVLPGWFGRDAWKGADLLAYDAIREVVLGRAPWWPSQVAFGEGADLLSVWLGAAAVLLFGFAPPELASRVPFAAALGLTLACTWYASYYLARQTSAQPVGFAFGGEANTVDYARTVADGALLALISSLGLAFLSHLAGPSVLQLCAASLGLCGVSALPFRSHWPVVALPASVVMLALAGAPGLAITLGLVFAFACSQHPISTSRKLSAAIASLLAVAAVAVFAGTRTQWLAQWRPAVPNETAGDLLRFWLWFAWPTLIFAVAGLYRWREHVLQPHLFAPLTVAVMLALAIFFTPSASRTFLLALPALACLSAFALPALSRSAWAFIDWLALLMFTSAIGIMWTIWFSVQWGVPAKPLANVMRRLPGFEPVWSTPAVVAALMGTAAWLGVVLWRTGRNRHALWKSTVLSAAGATVSWLLTMTLLLPILDYARSYRPQMALLKAHLSEPGCMAEQGLTSNQRAAVRVKLNREWVPVGEASACPYLLLAATSANEAPAERTELAGRAWQLMVRVQRPGDKNEFLLLYQTPK